MRDDIASFVIAQLLRGNSVTVGTPERHSRHLAWQQLLAGLSLSSPKLGDNPIYLGNGAYVQFIDLSRYSGCAVMHTPVVVLVDVRKANQVLISDARVIGCCFPNGDEPIVIEC